MASEFETIPDQRTYRRTKTMLVINYYTVTTSLNIGINDGFERSSEAREDGVWLVIRNNKGIIRIKDTIDLTKLSDVRHLHHLGGVNWTLNRVTAFKKQVGGNTVRAG